MYCSNKPNETNNQKIYVTVGWGCGWIMKMLVFMCLLK